MSKVLMGPFNRVEGDLEVELDIQSEQIRTARINAPMYRGFEQILKGKDPFDALVLTPRICGICSVSHSVAAARALESFYSDQPTPLNGLLCANLIHATENAADLLTHFYQFFMPDFANPIYQSEPWYEGICQRFGAIKGEAAKKSLEARSHFLRIMGILAGKWPHSLTIQPGGCSLTVDKQKRVKVESILKRFRSFLEKETFGIQLENLQSLSSREELQTYMMAGQSDLQQFLILSDKLQLEKLGKGSETLISFGSGFDGESWSCQPGIWRGKVEPLQVEWITEDISHAKYVANQDVLPPAEGQTNPEIDKENAYSWVKAPRLNGDVAEVGALARQVIGGNALIRALHQESGSNVQTRILARMLELARIVISMETWLKMLRDGHPFYQPIKKPKKGKGVGLVEAARGSLGHWIEVKKGVIENYQVIAPTTWNFSPRDLNGTPGPAECAVEGTKIRKGQKHPVEVQHIIRSYDPCMVCTVH